jgi:hypothetical protein
MNLQKWCLEASLSYDCQKLHQWKVFFLTETDQMWATNMHYTTKIKHKQSFPNVHCMWHSRQYWLYWLYCQYWYNVFIDFYIYRIYSRISQEILIIFWRIVFQFYLYAGRLIREYILYNCLKILQGIWE